MNKTSLLLHPLTRTSLECLDLVISLLKQRSFLGKLISPENNTYRIGDHFLQQIIFMGCSPAIRYEPASDQDQKYVYIQLVAREAMQLLVSTNAKPPTCPFCRKAVSQNWQEEIPKSDSITCQSCAKESQVVELGWKKDSAYANLWIAIYSIFPEEAQPVDALIKDLESTTQSRWRYSYITQ